MATKEEHLWRLTLSGEIRERDLRPWLCESLAERDAAREEAADWKSKFEHADATAEQVLGLWNGTLGMREELATLKAAQPESAPVVGGVTEEMLDEIAKKRLIPVDFGNAMYRARDAISAQKRVDVEMLRKLAASFAKDGLIARASLMRRAIGDEPAETPVAEPAAPEGPFRSRVYDIPSARCQCGATGVIRRLDAVCVARDADAEVEKLRARVAELDRHASNYAKSYQAEKARADAAEAKLAEDCTIRRALTQTIIEAIGSTGCPEDLEQAVERLLAKLAALGENPIPRALVERHAKAAVPYSYAQLVLDHILAGRELGVAS